VGFFEGDVKESVGLSGMRAGQSNPAPVQTYFVSLPDQQVSDSFDALDNYQGRIGSVMRNIISIVAALDNTIIYYDHWEDGYEIDIANPYQSTAQIWGDSNSSNGIPPGFASDVINAGDVVALENDVTLPRNPSQIFYDSRDKFGVTHPVAVSHALWAPDPGPVLAGAIEVYDVSKFGTNFTIPVGEDIVADGMFDYVSLFVMAAEDDTSVKIDVNGDGDYTDPSDVDTTLDQGEGHHVDGGVNSGASVNSSKPVQAHLITGDPYPDGYYESRWFTLFPTNLWSDSYYSPVGVSSSSDPANVFIYNPHSSSITIYNETLGGSGSFTVSAKSVYRYTMPLDSGAHFYTSDNNTFIAVSTIDSDSTDNDAYDWGFSLVPESSLTTVALIDWGPGTSDLSANGSPVWVTAINNTTLYVDYDGDPTTGPLIDPYGNHHDFNYTLTALQSQRVFDNNDNDQTGMRIYTVDNVLIAAAWGEDPATADTGNPFLDMGKTVLPMTLFLASKDSMLYNDTNGNGYIDPGDTLLYTITINNTGNVPLRSVIVVDELPVNATYVLNTTEKNGAPVSDDIVPPAATEFPLDEGGLNIGNIPPDDVSTLIFQATIDNPLPPGTHTIKNTATVITDQGIVVDTETTIIGHTEGKVLYLSEPSQGMDRIDPVATGDNTTATSVELSTGSLTGWQYRRNLTLDNSAQSENLMNFSVLVVLNSTRINYGQTQNNGEDLRFTDADGTLLAYEIEEWNENGNSYVWVKVPQVDGSSSTDYIWMYYGNSGASDGQNPANVWNSNYVGVWHLGEDPGTAGSGGIKDSTSYGNNGTDEGGMDSDDHVMGQVGYGIDFDGSNDIIRIDNSDGVGHSLDFTAGPFTIEGWTSIDTDEGTIVSKRDGVSCQYQFFHGNTVGGDNTLRMRGGSEYGYVNQILSTGPWYYFAVTVDSSEYPELFIDGSQKTWIDDIGSRPFAFPHQSVDVSIGARWASDPTTGWQHDGVIDEVRILNTARSADWIAAQYKSMSDTFVTYDAEEPLTAGGTPSTEFSQSPSMACDFDMPAGETIDLLRNNDFEQRFTF